MKIPTTREEMNRALRHTRGRAEDAVNVLRLRRAVFDARQEIDLQLRQVGELLYATYKGSPSDSGDVQRILEYVDSLYDQIAAHEKQIRILQGAVFCDACGGENAANSVYCQECGEMLAID